MRRFLDYEGGFFTFLSKITDCICLSLLWLLTSLPIITIGAATTALYYTVNKSFRHNRGYVWQGYWSSFISNFKQATCAWIGIVLVFIVFAADGYIFYQSDEYSSYSIAFLFLMGIVIVCSLYLFAHIARFTDKLKKALKNSLIMLYMNIHWSILLFVIFLVTVIVVFSFPFVVFFMPTLFMLLVSLILERVFKKCMTPEEVN